MARSTTARKPQTMAHNRPVTPRKILDAQEVDLGAPPDIEIPSTGPLPPRSNKIAPQTEDLKFKDHTAALAFNEEKLVIMIHETTDENADQKVFLGINGRGVWLTRGVHYRIARKYVERLARAKTEGVHTIQGRDADNNHITKITRSRALRYPFDLVEDKNPKGRAWLNSILAQP